MAYSFIHIDRCAADLSSMAAKYKTLRLEALRQSPTAFSSTLKTESQFNDDVWVSRLRDPEKETFICVLGLGQSSEWVAQVTLRGPLSDEEFTLPSESGQSSPARDGLEEKWQMLSLYSLPSHRGKGLAAKLCQEAFHFLESQQGTKAPHILVRIMVKPENTATIHLYERLGFKHAGHCTLEEALRANGDSHLIPKGKLEDKYTTRSGVIMALQLCRDT
jgi:ribosomal protein S18 acetylase RimI-like enzyme